MKLTMPIKWIVFNGPPQSGKSSAANWLAKAIKGIYQRDYRRPSPIVVVDSIDAPMKHFVATAFGEKFRDMNLTTMRAELMGYSVRSWIEGLRSVSEKDFGDDVFARLLVHRNLRGMPLPDYVVVDDGRAEQEGEIFTKPRIVCVRREIVPSMPLPAWWAKADTFIHNTRDHEHMYEQVTMYARRIVEEDLKAV